MHYFIILFSLLFLAGNTQPEPRVLSVMAEGTVELPADIIQFDINLNAEAKSPQAAYQLHKEREEVLVNLLKEFEVDESDINFQPVAISKARHYDRPQEEETTYQTSQMIRLTLQDFNAYEQIQIGLIEHGFDNFSGYFKSSKETEGQNKALREAVRKARENARIIADEAGVQLGSIARIQYRDQQNRPMQYRLAGAAMESADGLMQYDQVVMVTATIQVDFSIIESGN
jgi:uncharacterized protein YggE